MCSILFRKVFGNNVKSTRCLMYLVSRLQYGHFYFLSSLENSTGGKAGQHSRNFKWSKNREDSSDFDNIWSNRIAAVPAKSAKQNAPSKNLSQGKKRRKSSRIRRKSCPGFPFLTKNKMETAIC